MQEQNYMRIRAAVVAGVMIGLLASVILSARRCDGVLMEAAAVLFLSGRIDA